MRGYKVGDVDGIMRRVEMSGFFVDRAAAETDATIKQIIPYLVLRDGDRIFLMKRTRAGGDARLHELYSVGVGGHLNPGDGTPLAQPFHDGYLMKPIDIPRLLELIRQLLKIEWLPACALAGISALEFVWHSRRFDAQDATLPGWLTLASPAAD